MRYGIRETVWGLSGPALALHGWGDDHNTLVLGLGFVRLYVGIPTWIIREYDVDRGYGFSFCDTGLHVSWGKKTKVLWYPWSWDFYKRWESVTDGHWRGDPMWVEIPRRMNHGHIATKQTADYTYTRKSGDVQKVTATFYVSRMEHRWRWLKWLPWPRKVSDDIWVEFSAEVGEGTGSWKGGTVGCGYELRPNETALECLRRMERERKFDR
jgi:hypothetical protein